MSERFRNFCLCMTPSILCVAIQNAVMIFGAQVYLVYVFFSLPAAEDKGNISGRFMNGILSNEYLMGVSLGYAAIGVLLFWRWYRSVKSQEMLMDAHVAKRDSLRGYSVLLYLGIILLACGAQYVCSYIVAVLAHARPDWMEVYEELMESLELSGGSASLLTILYVVLLGPICEELCFRGLTLRFGLRMMKPQAANILQAILFGGMHANPLQSIYAFAFGWVLGKVYVDTDNLLVPVLIHVAFNGVSMVAENYIGVGETPVTFYCILLVSLMATYLGYLLIARAAREKNALNGAE